MSTYDSHISDGGPSIHAWDDDEQMKELDEISALQDAQENLEVKLAQVEQKCSRVCQTLEEIQKHKSACRALVEIYVLEEVPEDIEVKLIKKKQEYVKEREALKQKILGIEREVDRREACALPLMCYISPKRKKPRSQ